MIRKKLLIAIDGPSGSGKSTLAKELAKILKIHSMDSGALYRMMALYCKENNVDIKNMKTLKSALKGLTIRVSFEENKQLNFFNGIEVSDKIRNNDISLLASEISAIGYCRKLVVKIQKKFVKDKNSLIMDGRDIGTVIMPNANFKFFLVADINARAKRRFLELQAKNKSENLTVEQIRTAMIERDCKDAFRVNSPLKITKKSIVIDCSTKSIDEVVSTAFNIIKQDFDIEHIKE